MKNWFSIKAQANDDSTAEISIHDAIGAWNVNAQSFLAELKNVSAKNITLTMNSLGGDLIDGIAIYNGLRNHAEKNGATITVKVMGIVASIASIIAMAGDKIKMPKNTFMMVHSPSAGLYANANEMRGMADWLDKFESGLIATYVARTGKTEEEIKALLDAETLMTAEEALALGFADEVTDALVLTASFDLDNLPDNITAIFNSAKNEIPEQPNDPIEPVDPSCDDENELVEFKPEASFFSQIVATAERYNVQEFANVFLLDASLANAEQVEASIRNASEIKVLCSYLNRTADADALIEARISVVEARAKLAETAAAKADKFDTNNHQSSIIEPPVGAPQGGFSVSNIYAARKPKGK